MSKDSKSAAAFSTAARLNAERSGKRAADAEITAVRARVRAEKAHLRLAERASAARRSLTPPR